MFRLKKRLNPERARELASYAALRRQQNRDARIARGLIELEAELAETEREENADKLKI